MVIYSGQFTAFINGKPTNIDFTGKFNYTKSIIRVTFAHHQKQKNKAAIAAKQNNFLTEENYQSGYYDFYLEDEDHNQYKYAYRMGGMSNYLDNGIFYKKIEK